jgi:hypothetical protein
MSARNPAVKTKRLVRLVVIALLFPAFYSLSAANPDWLLGFDLQAQPRSHDHGSHDRDYSPVPGVQGHPADHQCTPCEILKSLASYLPAPAPAVPAALRHALPPSEWDDPEYSRRVVSLPPSRAPPPRTA